MTHRFYPTVGLRIAARLFCATALAAVGVPAAAQFALAVSPPRFELTAKPGERQSQVVELTQMSTDGSTYKVKTTDWSLQPDGGVDFSDDLQPDSCRPWVSIERREVAVSSGRPYRFRFEVTAPAGTAPTECRFALMFEGKDAVSGPKLPVAISARIAVIVYVAIGDVAPALELVGTRVKTIDGKALPVLEVRNTGTAHGRLAGFLSGTDAAGGKFELQPATTPIMPGETRDVALSATRPGDVEQAVSPKFPLKVSGKLEWGSKGAFEVDQRFAP